MKSIELAIKAGRLRQSPATHFVHHSAEKPDYSREVIPVYENFCFALALFRSKMAANALEGKSLLEKLFAFQTAEGFPVYLHDYPRCHFRQLSQKLAPIAFFLLKDFSSILGEPLREKLQALAALLTPPSDPKSPEEWADFLIYTQIIKSDSSDLFGIWDFKSQCFMGPQKQAQQEPAVTLLDLILGEWTGSYSLRALQDHPAHLQASLIYPGHLSCREVQQKWSRKFWGDGSPTHSAMLQTKGVVSELNNTVFIDLPSQEVYDEVETSYYINRGIGTQLFVQGLKATAFQLGEPVIIESGCEKFKVIFSLEEGSGRFWGHLYFGNRPGQMGSLGSLKYEAFDWQIALRTVERKERCLLKMEFSSELPTC
jgi:hypothetical protein